MTRTERLFAIAEHLRGRRSGTTAEALSERFGVSLRTMYRDLRSLRAADLPLNADRGRGGGYALDRSYALPPVNFTAREAAVLLVAARLVRDLRVMPFVGTLNAAEDRLRAALPPRTQRELHDLIDSLTFTGVPTLPVDRSMVDVIEQAWFERLPLTIVYRGAHGTTTTRRVRLKQVVLERSLTLLNCDDLDKGEPRQFRLDRIERATLATP